MIGDGLSHVSFGTTALATALGLMTPIYIAMPLTVIAAILMLINSSGAKAKGDTAIAMISTGSLALGVLIISVTKGMNTELNNYLFGSILAMSNSDMWVSIILSAIVLVVFVLHYNTVFSVTFDEQFAKATGVKTSFFNTLIAVLTAVTVVLGMRMMGSMLISALIIFPALPSMQIFKPFKAVTLSSAVLSVVCVITGLIVSCFWEVPAGACVVVVNIAAFLIFYILSAILKINK
jgi:zinc transport system permease protein